VAGLAQFKRVVRAAPDLAQKIRAGTLAVDRAARVVRDRDAQDRRISLRRRPERNLARAKVVPVGFKAAWARVPLP
jgi:hypothetical protein